MRDIFNLEGPFFTTINRVGDLIFLNILWFICCIPIVTIGASTTALYYVSMKLAEKNDGYIARNFFKSFKQNFRQSTVIWLIMGPVGFGISYYLFYVLFVDMKISDTLLTGALALVMLLTLVYAMIFVYIFPLQSKFENKIKHTFKNAFILSLRHLPQTIILILTFVLAIFCLFRFSIMFPIYLLIGVATIAFAQSYIYNSIFNIYIKRNKPENEVEKDPDAWTVPEDEE